MGGVIGKQEKKRLSTTLTVDCIDNIQSLEQSTVRQQYSNGPPLANLRLVLTNDMGRDAFVSCMRENSSDGRNFFRDANYAPVLRRISDSDSSEEAMVVVSELKCFTPDDLEEFRQFSPDSQCIEFPAKDTFFSILNDCRNELLVLMVMDMYTTFEQSNYYKQWREMERSGEEKLTAHASNKTVRSSTAHSYDARELRKIIDISWLKTLLKCLSKLPVAVTLLNASTDRPGFPIEYANDAFFESSRLDKTKVIGRGFIKTYVSELSGQEKIEEIRETLVEGKMSRIELDVKQGSSGGPDHSKCILFTKAIFDFTSKHRYCLVVHKNIGSGNHVCPYELKVVSDLVDMVPDTIAIDKRDEDLTNLYVKRQKDQMSKKKSSHFE